MSKTKIGFIGAGNMATAIIGGIANSELSDRADVVVFDVAEEKAKFLEQKYSCVTSQNDINDITSCCDYILLAIKPQNFDEVLETIKNSVNKKAVVISIAAGITAEYIKEKLGYDCKVVLVMPNTPLLLGCGATALSKVASTSLAEFEFVKGIFDASGISEEVSRDKMKEIIAINGSSPAFVYLFAKGFVQYAKSVDIDVDVALKLFCKTLEGSAKMMTESGYDLEELIKMVSSPGGTTLKGLDSFYQHDLLGIINDACKQCTNRAYELSK
ncbi:MAG: pyrroline-5-carboxylate reductase [Oscillospiraceae bacterium]|nr:pyrroline-5-carboxylate reductase [Oscillospiraceae bacterium]